VKVNHVTREQFIEIFHLVCKNYQVDYNEAAVSHLLSHHYDDGQRSMDACHPRDSVEQVLDFSIFHQVPPVLSPETLDRACRVYFVE
jgi:hypothetical protein